MKIAVTAKGAGLGAWLDPAFEHCLQIVVVDDEDRFSSFVPRALGEGARAGLAAAERLVAEGVSLVITGSIAEREHSVLLDAGVQVRRAESGSVLELVDQARAGGLPEISL